MMEECREWIRERALKNLECHTYLIVNNDFDKDA